MTSPFKTIGEAATRVIDHHAFRQGQIAERERHLAFLQRLQDMIAREIERAERSVTCPR